MSCGEEYPFVGWGIDKFRRLRFPSGGSKTSVDLQPIKPHHRTFTPLLGAASIAGRWLIVLLVVSLAESSLTHVLRVQHNKVILLEPTAYREYEDSTKCCQKCSK
jgi:hypothetical protein